MQEPEKALEGANVTAMPARRLTIQLIKRLVAEANGLTCADMEGPSRARAIAWPRQEAMWLCRQHTTSSLPQIGRAFGDRDHTTVLHAERQIDKRIAAGRVDEAELHAIVAQRPSISHPVAMELAACIAIGQFIASTDFHGCFYHSNWLAWQARHRNRAGLAKVVESAHATAA